MVAIGKPGKKGDLSEDLQDQENPSDRRPLNEIVMEGGFKVWAIQPHAIYPNKNTEHVLGVFITPQPYIWLVLVGPRAVAQRASDTFNSAMPI